MGKGDRSPDDQSLQFDQKVREQLFQGCKLVKDLEEKLQSTPLGKLGEANNFELRSSFAMDSVAIIASFNETVKLLISSSSSSTQALTSAEFHPVSVLPLRPKRERSCIAVDRNVSTSRNVETPLITPVGFAAPTAKCLFPSSESPLSSNSPGSENMSDDSPPRITASAPDMAKSDAGTEARPGRSADGADTADANTSGDGRRKRRKLSPKIAVRMHAGSLDQGADQASPNDGHTWRKYGQKEILGARYPRSYYRCTHKTDLGCEAIKQVQRCEHDFHIFEVTYRGRHSCRSTQLDAQFWPFAHYLPQIALPSSIELPGSSPPLISTATNVPSALSWIRKPSLISNMPSLPSSSHPQLLASSVSSPRTPVSNLVASPKPLENIRSVLSNVGAIIHPKTSGDFSSVNYPNLTGLPTLLHQRSSRANMSLKIQGTDTDGSALKAEGRGSESSEKDQQPQQQERRQQDLALIATASHDESPCTQIRSRYPSTSIVRLSTFRATPEVVSSAQSHAAGLITESSFPKADQTKATNSGDDPAESSFEVPMDIHDNFLNCFFDMEPDPKL